jgi:tetratricopeptide (TPR) repeat protein
MQRILQVAVLCLVPLAAQQGPQWKNQAESDLYTAIQKENDAQKKLALIDAWKAKFPDTELKQQRLAAYLNVYQQLNDVPKLIQTLNEMLTLDPKDLRLMNGIMVYALQSGSPRPEDVDNAASVARSALTNLDVKPTGVEDAQWPVFRRGVESLAHTTLGWAAMNRKDTAAAEEEFVRSLEVDPNQGQVDLWLAGVLRGQKTPDKVSRALFYYARAAVYDGSGALPAQIRQQYSEYLRKAYTSYHGEDAAGLDELKKLARSQPLPPPDFKILTADDVAAQKQQQLQQSNPQLALWQTLKQQLTAAGGRQFFENTMKGAAVPGGAQGVNHFKGTLIAAKPPVRSRELVVGVSDPKAAEVTLKLDTPLAGKPEIGTQLEFAGVPAEFTPDPFNVTFAVERVKLKGLKLQPAPAGQRKSATRHR